MKKKYGYTGTIKYEANGKVIPVEVFQKKCLRSAVELHKKKGEFSPVPLKSAFAMILNGDRPY